MKLKLFFLFFILCSALNVFGQNQSFWSKVEPKSLSEGEVIEYASTVTNPKYFALDKSSLENYIKNSPDRFTQAKSSFKVSLPNPDGKMDTFTIFSTQTMSKALASKFPDITSYVGYNVTDKSHIARITLTPQGFYGMTMGSKHGTTLINPYLKNSNQYLVFSSKDAVLKEQYTFKCEVEENFNKLSQKSNSNIPKFVEDGVLRKFRLAVSTTVEYSDFHLQEAGFSAGDTSSAARTAVQAAIVVSIDRVNQIYERDLSIHLELIDNNDQLISLGNAATDGFTEGDLFTMLNENKTKIDNTIGFDNYDIGHVFCSEGGGLAQTPAVCLSGKARGASGTSSPAGEYFNIGIISHEIGHQFGASHTQSSDVNENFPTAMEPGSGSTIMSYAGVGPPNVQNRSDAMFHYISIQQMSSRFSGTTGNCAQLVSIQNEAPVVQALADYTIPKSTPIRLEVVATDINEDELTYSWEQLDNDVVPNVPMPPESTSTTGPLFRAFLPSSSPTRHLPSMSSLLNNNYSNTWEVLPSVARTLNFGVIIRDNSAFGGQVAHENTTLTVVDSAGPFRVTSQTNLENPWEAGTTKTITWDVANTNDPNGVNAQNVDILLSTDSGITYPIVLATNTPNDGSHNITVPNVVSENARLMVKASDNVFFDINAQAFSIGTVLDPTYCEAGTISTGITNISRVKFNTIDNQRPTGEPNMVYRDYTNLSTTVFKNQTYTLEVYEDENIYLGDKVIAWIDYNKNGVFTDPGEKVIETVAFDGDFSNYPFGGDITIPETAIIGETTMRIRLDYSFVDPNSTPCGDSYFGAVEDYTINITSSTFNITTSESPSEGGSTSGGGIVNNGQSTTVSASPNTGYSFVNWTEYGLEVSTNPSYTFVPNNNRDLVANFIKTPYTVSVSSYPTAGGSTSGEGIYTFGQSATVVASANTGYTFVNWTENGSEVSTDASYTFTVDNNRTLVANFSLNSYTISTSSNPTAGGTTSGGGNFDFGQSATVVASANTGYTFVNWTENGSEVSTDASYTFSVDSDRTLVANFSLNSYTVSTSANPTAGGTTAGGGNFDFGQSATVVASANTGYTFVNWTENGSEVSTNASYTFSVDSDRDLVANFETTLDTNDFESYDFYVYPNPSNYGQFNIRVGHLKDKRVSLKIYDLLGKQVLIQNRQINSNGIIQVDASDLASGVYFIKLQHDRQQFISKWVRN